MDFESAARCDSAEVADERCIDEFPIKELPQGESAANQTHPLKEE
jgi:hypothetical protein